MNSKTETSLTKLVYIVYSKSSLIGIFDTITAILVMLGKAVSIHLGKTEDVFNFETRKGKKYYVHVVPMNKRVPSMK
jgi:hypothetical protein